MRLSKRSVGACTLACIALPLGFFGCAREGSKTRDKSEVSTGTQALRGELLVPWGTGQNSLTFHPGGDESHARGPDAVVFASSGGGYLVLDSLAHRVVEVDVDNTVRTRVADIPHDADGLAVSGKGEVALHRAVSAQVDLYNGRGRHSGSVAIPLEARDAIFVHLLSQGRVMLEHPFQERYLLGSPNMPRQPELVVPTRREGVGSDFSTTGYEVVVRHPAGEAPPKEIGRGIPPAGSHAYLVEAKPREGEPAEHGTLPYQHKEIADLGEGTSARIIGVANDRVCAVLEHLDLEAPVVDVTRDVVCTSLGSNKVFARIPIETSKIYTLRQELVFDGVRIGQALPTSNGLKLRTIVLGEVSQ